MALDFFKKRWKLFTAIGVCLILAVFGWWFLTRNKSSQTGQSAVATVKRGNIKVNVSATGTAKSTDSNNVTAKVSGALTAINVKDGQTVTKGQLLFQLDSQSARSDLNKAVLDREQSAIERGSISDELSQQQVTAPISGQVTSIAAVKGQDLQKGTVVMTITNTSALIAKIPMNIIQISGVKTGQKADVTVPSMGGSIMKGTVTKVDRGGVANSDGSRAYYATVQITNPGGLAPGLEAQAAIHTPAGVEYGYESALLAWADAIDVRSGVAGNLKTIYVDDNTYVRKGQRLAYIAADGVGDQLATSDLKYQAANINVNNLQKEIADYNIYAPCNGVLNISSAETSGNSSSNSSSTTTATTQLQVGDEVKAGQILGSVSGSAGMEVTVPVDEVDIAKVKLGQKADITFDALPDQTFTGNVTTVGSQGIVQNSVANFDVTVSIDNPQGIKSGMTANVEILVDNKDGVLLVPIEAVQERGSRKFVILANTGNRDQSAGSTRRSAARAGSMREVETGIYNESVIEIKSGLAEGDKVTLPSVAKSSNGTGNGSSGGSGGNNHGGFGGGRPF